MKKEHDKANPNGNKNISLTKSKIHTSTSCLNNNNFIYKKNKISNKRNQIYKKHLT